jgi:hypothetical protein
LTNRVINSKIIERTLAVKGKFESRRNRKCGSVKLIRK